ncbi:MAG: hypothetical protein RIQ94_232 [Pseudomonadota bacterium]|jgi:hypothetical protein
MGTTIRRYVQITMQWKYHALRNLNFNLICRAFFDNDGCAHCETYNDVANYKTHNRGFLVCT